MLLPGGPLGPVASHFLPGAASPLGLLPAHPASLTILSGLATQRALAQRVLGTPIHSLTSFLELSQPPPEPRTVEAPGRSSLVPPEGRIGNQDLPVAAES